MKRLWPLALLIAPLLSFTFFVADPKFRVECVAGCGDVKLIEPFGVAFDNRGNWYICEYKGQRITRVDRNGRAALFAGPQNNLHTFHDPHGLVISKDQQMYIADTLNHQLVRINIRNGDTVVAAGTGQRGFSGDGGPAKAASFNQLYAVDIDRDSEKLYITDLGNRRIRLMDLKTGNIRTVAGNGQSAAPEDGADAATSPLVDPRAAAIDSKGNLYILERRGNAMRVVDKNGKIRTAIKPGSIDPDLNGPKYVCVDRSDNVIIADAENHLIRRYNPKDGSTVIIAGTGEKGDRIVPADPLKTQLNRPHGVYVHSSGALYISDSYNHRVLRLTP